eukprot:scaffold88602_cov64-Phaeocystis_antarctica.AAC.7
MAARHGEVRLRESHAHDASGLAANGGLGSVVAAGDVADIGKCHHLLSRSLYRLSVPVCQVGFRESRRRHLTDADALQRLLDGRFSNWASLAAPCRVRLAPVPAPAPTSAFAPSPAGTAWAGAGAGAGALSECGRSCTRQLRCLALRGHQLCRSERRRRSAFGPQCVLLPLLRRH